MIFLSSSSCIIYLIFLNRLLRLSFKSKSREGILEEEAEIGTNGRIPLLKNVIWSFELNKGLNSEISTIMSTI